MAAEQIILKAASDGTSFVVSSRNPDRMADRIISIAEPPERLPALFNHDPSQPVGVFSDFRKDGDRWTMQFSPLDEGTSEVADVARKLIQQRFPMGASIAGVPGRMEPNDFGGFDIHDIELMETSLTPVPANAEAQAIFRSIDTKGIFQMTDTVTDNTQATPEPPPAPEPPTTLHKVAPAIRTEQREYSISRAVAMQLGIHGVDFGYEREVAAEIAKQSPGRDFKGAPVPWNAIFKANAGASGGNLNPLTDSDAGDRLLSFTGSGLPREFLGARLGVSTAVTEEMTLKVPTVDGKPAAVIVAQDGTITTSDSSTDSDDVAPVTVGCRTAVKRSTRYAHMMDAVLMKQVGDAVREGIDSTLIGPTAGAPTPSGLFDLATNATTVAVADTEVAYRAFIREVLAYLKGSGEVRLLMPGSVADALAVVPKWTGADRAVYEGGAIADVPVILSHELDESTPASTPIAVGDFSELFVCLFGNAALDVVANPWLSGSWEAGGYELRAMLDFNIHLRDAAAVLKGTSDRS